MPLVLLPLWYFRFKDSERQSSQDGHSGGDRVRMQKSLKELPSP